MGFEKWFLDDFSGIDCGEQAEWHIGENDEWLLMPLRWSLHGLYDDLSINMPRLWRSPRRSMSQAVSNGYLPLKTSRNLISSKINPFCEPPDVGSYFFDGLLGHA